MKWYEHKLQGAAESETCKILWDFSIQTIHMLRYNKPDVMVQNKVHHISCILLNASHFELRIIKVGEIDISSFPVHKLALLLKMKGKIVSIISGSLGIVSKAIKWNTKEIVIECSIELLKRLSLRHGLINQENINQENVSYSLFL